MGLGKTRRRQKPASDGDLAKVVSLLLKVLAGFAILAFVGAAVGIIWFGHGPRAAFIVPGAITFFGGLVGVAVVSHVENEYHGRIGVIVALAQLMVIAIVHLDKCFVQAGAMLLGVIMMIVGIAVVPWARGDYSNQAKTPNRIQAQQPIAENPNLAQVPVPNPQPVPNPLPTPPTPFPELPKSTPMPPGANPVPANPLVAHWTFDRYEADFGVTDFSGRGNHGRIFNPLGRVGVKGFAFVFTGNPNQYFDMGEAKDFDFDPGQDFTYIGWFVTAGDGVILCQSNPFRKGRGALKVHVLGGRLGAVIANDLDVRFISP